MTIYKLEGFSPSSLKLLQFYEIFRSVKFARVRYQITYIYKGFHSKEQNRRVPERQLVIYIYISSFKAICPIQQLTSCLDLSKINKNSDEYIFRDIFIGKVSKLRKRNIPMSYARIQDNFIQVLKTVVLKMEGVWTP